MHCPACKSDDVRQTNHLQLATETNWYACNACGHSFNDRDLDRAANISQMLLDMEKPV
jgi:transposase-like protein